MGTVFSKRSYKANKVILLKHKNDCSILTRNGALEGSGFKRQVFLSAARAIFRELQHFYTDHIRVLQH